MVLFRLDFSTGNGPMCAINRSSIFFLLSIQFHLCDLVRNLYVSLKARSQQNSKRLIWKVLSVGIPCLLMAISYAGLFEFVLVCHGLLMVSLFLITNACHQLNVARTVRQARTINSMWRGMHFRAQWGLVPFDPLGALACALCRRRIKFLDISVLSDIRFSNMDTEWGGYHLHLLFGSLLYPSLCYFDVSHGWRSIRIGVCEKGLVWWALSILCAQWLPFLCDVVTLLTFSLSLRCCKGSISFGAAHLRFFSAWFVTLLPLLSSLAKTKILYIHLNFFATENDLKWNDPSSRKYNTFLHFCLCKMSWYKITISTRSIGKSIMKDTKNSTVDSSKKRILRIAIMSGGCLLMNTAATVSVSVVLQDWSVSSDQWLTCTVAETVYTRNWANYGMHVGVRYFMFSSGQRDTCWLLFWPLLLHLLYQPSRVWTGWRQFRGSSRP